MAVIVISACHAGSFIDELRNVTIVLTAAARTRRRSAAPTIAT